MLSSYKDRSIIKNYSAENATKIQSETKDALDKIIMTYNNFRGNWEELQGKFYQISPEELRKLDSYYILENLKLQVLATN